MLFLGRGNPMTRILRRFGGLRKFILGISALVVGGYLLQMLLSPSSNTNSSKFPAPAISKSDSDLNPVTAPFPRFIQPTEPPNPVTKIQDKGNDNGQNIESFKQDPKDDSSSCTVAVKCGAEELTYSLSALIEERKSPHACLNNKQIFEEKKLAKGLNIIVLDEVKRAVQEIKYIDLQLTDREFVNFMSKLVGQPVLWVSSWGDVAEKLSVDSREILQKFGSEKVGAYKRGTSFIMIGQKGLKPGHAIEKVGQLTEKDTEARVQIQGCLKLPLGPIDPKVSLKNYGPSSLNPTLGIGLIPRQETVVYGGELPHCGMKDPCSQDTIAVYVYSGKSKDDEPKLCVDGRYLFSRNLNGAGRGLNIVIFNGTSREVVRVGHFDTYQEDSSTLEIFLEQTLQGQLIAVVSFDEASNRLSNMAKQMFYELGSGLVQNLKFRASWYFVGQKGITGFTPFEELYYASGSEWAKPIEARNCIPVKLDGTKARPDPSLRARNDARKHFCAKYDGYEAFCDDGNVDGILTPAPLFNRSMEGNAIFSVPILVVAGLSHNSLRLSLETLLRQPGINPQMVFVTFDENYPEEGELAKLFGFRAQAVTASASYIKALWKSLEAVWAEWGKAEAVMVVEEELIVTADFLSFMAQLLPLLHKDPSLLAISAWNNNGFQEVSTLPSAVYRVEEFPGLGFMTLKSTYDKYLKGRMETCCSGRSWDNWLTPEERKGKHILVPDISRVLRRHSDGLGVLDPHLEDLFHRKRAYTKDTDFRDGSNWLWKPEMLVQSEYDKHLNVTLSTAVPLTDVSLSTCVTTREKQKPTLPDSTDTNVAFVVYVRQNKPGDAYSGMRILCECFGLFHSQGQPPKGLYKDVLRFSYKSRSMMIVGSSSIFFSSKPSSVKVLELR